MKSTDLATVAILGAGSIGLAFAVVFARAGSPVRLYDPDATQRATASPRILDRLGDLARYGLIEQAPSAVLERVVVVSTVEACVAEADYIQECGPERLDLKQGLLAEIDRFARPDAVIASASSAIPMSRSAGALPGRARALVAHPGNPPFLIAVIELVPAPFTDPATVERATAILRRAGMSPVVLKRETEGFAFNRLQGALLREAYCLVRDGVASVADIDTIVRDGLGLRWSVIGPFETADLNTRGGIGAHAKVMGPAYERMGAERGQHDPWTPALVAEVEAQRRAALPLSGWAERVAWRDRRLMALIRHRNTEAEA